MSARVGLLGVGAVAVAVAAVVAASAAAEQVVGARSIFDPQSVPAARIDALARLILGICAAIFFVVSGALVYCVLRFRAGPTQASAEPAQLYGSGPIELAWTVLPLLIVFVLFLVTARTILELDPSGLSSDRIEVEITGYQWWWEVRYPALGVTTANEIHLPAPIDGRSVPGCALPKFEGGLAAFRPAV